jgi:hypothetical protein
LHQALRAIASAQEQRLADRDTGRPDSFSGAAATLKPAIHGFSSGLRRVIQGLLSGPGFGPALCFQVDAVKRLIVAL